MVDMFLENQVEALKLRIERIEEHLGLVPAGPAVSDLVAELARSGRTLEAIRVYRDETGANLTVAKDVVESLPR